MANEEEQARHCALLALAPELTNQIRPGEWLVRVERIPHMVPPAPLSAIRSLAELTPQAGQLALDRSGPIMAAGFVKRADHDPDVPPQLRLFEALFGRDALTCARILFPWYPGLVRRTVLALAQLQGIRDDVTSEEEPGRIPHEVRDPSDSRARSITAKAGWGWPYYGSVDATCLWIMLGAKLALNDSSFVDTPVQRRDGRPVTLGDCLGDAVVWLLHRLGRSGSGLLESAPAFPGSIENQVWKDSWDAYSHTDGTLATKGTIASVEVQALAHDALRTVTELPSFPLPGGLDRARRAIQDLRDRLLLDFWIDGGGSGFFALGLDRDSDHRPRALAIKSSNMGHLLLSEVLDGNNPEIRRKRQLLIAELVSPDMMCAAGIRTLSTEAPRFRPNAYHNGNSWPWDTYIVAAGLRKHGAQDHADALCQKIMAGHLATRHFPEFYSGDQSPTPHIGELVAEVTDESGRLNRICQPPQEVQAWTAAAVLAVKRGGRHF